MIFKNLTVKVLTLLFLSTSAFSQSQASSPLSEINLGTTPKIFGEGVISTSLSESRAAFTSDMSTVYFTVTDRAFNRMTIAFSRFVNGRWGTPEIAPFSGYWNDSDPFISPDGKRLYFISNRPLSGNEAKKDSDIWFVNLENKVGLTRLTRVSDQINSPMGETYPSIAASGTMYWGRQQDIYRARLVNGVYEQPEKLPFSGGSPCVSSDEGFIIFRGAGSNVTDGDLYVSFNENGIWTKPQKFAAPVNTPFNETAPSLTPDGKRLFFASERFEFNGTKSPREKKLSSFAELKRELEGMIYNGSRNIYEIDLSNLKNIKQSAVIK